MLIIRWLNSIDAATGIVTLSEWPSGAQVDRELPFPLNLYTGRTLTERTIPDSASIQFSLLMMSM